MNAHVQFLRDRINHRSNIVRQQRRIGIACLAVAGFSAIYFAGQMLRTVLP